MKKDHPSILALIVIVGSLAVSVNAVSTIGDLWKRKDVVRQRQDDVVLIEKENQMLEGKLREATSPAFLERQARNALGMIKEGEAIVLLPSRGNTAGQSTAVDIRENWKKWWELFF